MKEQIGGPVDDTNAFCRAITIANAFANAVAPSTCTMNVI